jgi:hypothetical protein
MSVCTTAWPRHCGLTGINALAARVAVHGRHLAAAVDTSRRLGTAAHGPRRDAQIAAELQRAAGHEAAHGRVGVEHNQKVRHLGTDIEAAAQAADAQGRGRRPAVLGQPRNHEARACSRRHDYRASRVSLQPERCSCRDALTETDAEDTEDGKAARLAQHRERCRPG